MQVAKAAAPNTSRRPKTNRRTAHFHPRVKIKKTSTAGFKVGLPSQNETALPTEAPLLRNPFTRGAVQHVHIIPGSANSPPKAQERKDALPNTRASQSRGTSTSTVAAKSSASTSAFQIALKYVIE